MSVLKKTAAGNYRAESVKRYVKELKELYDRDFDEIRGRLVSLSDENKYLRDELDTYAAKEKYIATAILKAEDIAQQIIDEAEKNAKIVKSAADNYEANMKAKVNDYIKRLIDFEKNVSVLLDEVVHITALYKENDYDESIKMPSAADVYHILNSLRKEEETSLKSDHAM